jgi:hypothetical protein
MSDQGTVSIKIDPDDEKIKGAKAIGQALGISEQRAFYALERGLIPATKFGRQWLTTRRRLRALGADAE